MNQLPGLIGGELCLVDTEPRNLERMLKLGQMAAESSGSGTRITGTTNFREALPGADFVVLSFSEQNSHFRRIDCEVSAKYGVRMCSGDTIGPGGVFRAMREFGQILEITKEVESVCPDAWVINYINPSSVMGIGLFRHSKVKSFALCDTHHMPNKKLSYLKMLGLEESELDSCDIRIAGVNHFTWMLQATHRGRDIIPDLRDAFYQLSLSEKDTGYAKGRFNSHITAQLTDVFGALPTCTGHTKEYLPYYQGRSPIRESIPPLSVFDCDEREALTEKMWEDIDRYFTGEKTMEEFYASHSADHATDIINTMVTEDQRTYFINRTNNDCVVGQGRAVGNMPDDAFLELECVLDRNGPRPLHVGDFPYGLRSLQMQILDVHELTIEAIMLRDRGLLIRALALDPLVQSIATAKQIVDELLIAQADVLGDWSTPVVTAKDSNVGLVSGSAPQLY